MLTLTGKVLNVFPTNEFKDQKTGEITEAGHKVQLQYEEPVVGKGKQESGTKLVLKDFNVRALGEQYKKAIGKEVTVPVGMWVDPETRKPGLYILRDCLPTIISHVPSQPKA